MTIIKWANGKGFTIQVTEVERQELLALLRCEAQTATLDNATYELEIVRD